MLKLKSVNRILISVADQERETLLHFGARLGLKDFILHVLTLPEGEEALNVKNVSGLLPLDVATNACYGELAQMLTT